MQPEVFPTDAFRASGVGSAAPLLTLVSPWDLTLGAELTVAGALLASGILQVDGLLKGLKLNSTALPAAAETSHTIADTDRAVVYLVTTGSASDYTVVLPTAADNTGKYLTVVKADSGTKKVIVDGEGAETILWAGAAATVVNLPTQGNFLTLFCNGTSWLPLHWFASYLTGWINRSDWTNVHIGSNTTLNTDSNVTHGLNAPLPRLAARLFISTDGTDANSLEVLSNMYNSSAGNQYGIQIFAVDNNNVKIQTADSGIIVLTDAGGVTGVDTENWYYQAGVWCRG